MKRKKKITAKIHEKIFKWVKNEEKPSKASEIFPLPLKNHPITQIWWTTYHLDLQMV